MRIIGINDGYAATAALIENGTVTRMVGEERFTRVKNHSGFPENALSWVFEDSGLSSDDIDGIAYATRSATIKVDAPFNTFRHRFFSQTARFFPGILGNHAFIEKGVEHMASKRAGRVAECPSLKKFGLNGKPRSIYDHHDCHIAAGYFGSGFSRHDDKTLVISYDGSGDGICCKVCLADKGRFEPLHTISSYHSIGILYSRITQLLGMKAMEHEYKVMGMAPYCSPDRAEKACEILTGFLRLTDGGSSMINVSRTWGTSMVDKLYYRFKGHRFDWIAAGAQLHFERMMLPFILYWLKRTGAQNIVLSGGCFMNVKLNMLLSQRDEIGRLYILPSCGDESIALGAAYLKSEEMSPGSSQPLQNLYLGNECGREEIDAALNKYKTDVVWREVEDPELETAQMLHDNLIVARCRGRMEWGSRALGNRSILANPNSMTTIHRINKAIKMRDFWMPFAPSILHERRHDYLVNPRDHEAFFMILALPSTNLAYRHMPAALHPFDLTCRPQLVTQEMNPRYHYLLSSFERLSGSGGVLNTSYNLHGFPIVSSAEDAIQTFIQSDLDALALENRIVRHKTGAE